VWMGVCIAFVAAGGFANGIAQCPEGIPRHVNRPEKCPSRCGRRVAKVPLVAPEQATELRN
jgi:hypothetical protein